MSSSLIDDSTLLQGSQATRPDPRVTALQDWLCRYVGQILNVAPERIDPDVKFDRHGLDSSAAVGLAGDLSTWLECELDPTLAYDFPTITELAVELARRDDVCAALRRLV